ncbi:iron/manganese superoxide dismutase domain-containing protein [Pseudomassariella vexata]|uniref:Superoxide dismutase n=1 Tax=Pseudomassariella vexata TaxID=1141098 RepID=A0A1Y2DI24_9PEZI|nr:iron/manganese superoxide dismutase domain-containing protein [Pseudomassariella vexata]ORY58465.1 iron/manganese superoxide dismutase domain-containing protein [Pseudomassariella vexata]
MPIRLPTTSLRTAGQAVRGARPASVVGGITFARGKATLPDLSYDYGALEPFISGKIMELHHKGHHQTYVNGLNSALEAIADAKAKGNDMQAAAVAPLLNFHGGGHTNHTLFWENLAPNNKGGGGEPEGSLKGAIEKDFGSFATLKKQVNTALAGIQGSGWVWLALDKTAGTLQVITRPNQDPVIGNMIPLLGIDAWEHAYYLQYQNRKAEYFENIWNVVNWKTVAKRLEKAA